MFQSNYQQPNIMYQGGKDRKRNLIDQSLISNVHPGFKQQTAYPQNYQLMPQYYPQYMQENITSNDSSFLRAFSHFPLLPSSMSTNAKGICGLLTTVLFTILVIVVIGLTPIWIKAANNNLLNTNGTIDNDETDNQEFSIDLKNAIQLENSSLASILAIPASERTAEQLLSLKSATTKLTEQLNDKTKPKLNSDIKEIYNVRLSPQSDDLVSVSYTLKTNEISEEKGNSLRIELDKALEDPDLYDNIVLKSGSTINHIVPNKNETIFSISNLIKGEVLQISDLNRGQSVDDFKEYKTIPVTKNNYVAPKIVDNGYQANQNEDGTYYSELDELKDGPILYPRPYEQGYDNKQYNEEYTSVDYEDDTNGSDVYYEEENSDVGSYNNNDNSYEYQDNNNNQNNGNMNSYEYQGNNNNNQNYGNMNGYESNEDYQENKYYYPESTTTTKPNVTHVPPFRWRVRDIRKLMRNKRKNRRDLVRSRKLVRALINLRKRIRTRRLQPFRVASNIPRKAGENWRQVFLRRRIAVLNKRLEKLNEFRRSCTLPVLQGSKNIEETEKQELKGFLIPDGIRPKSIMARFRNRVQRRKVIRGLRRLKEDLMDERVKVVTTPTTTKETTTTKKYNDNYNKKYSNSNGNYNSQRSDYKNGQNEAYSDTDNYNGQKTGYNGNNNDNYNGQNSNDNGNYNGQNTDYNNGYNGQNSAYNNNYQKQYSPKPTTIPTTTQPTTTTHRPRFKFILDDDLNSISFLQRRIRRIKSRIRRRMNRIAKCIKNNTFLKVTTTPKPTITSSTTKTKTAKYDDNYGSVYSDYSQGNNGYNNNNNNVYLKSSLNLQLENNNGSNSTTSSSTEETTTLIN